MGTNLDLEAHWRNCLKSLEWIGRNLSTRDESKPNLHWQRQQVRLSRTKDLDPHLIILDSLSWQLPQALEPIIPDIKKKMQAVKMRNVSYKPFTRDKILTPKIVEAVKAVYPLDTETVANARRKWGPPPQLQE